MLTNTTTIFKVCFFILLFNQTLFAHFENEPSINFVQSKTFKEIQKEAWKQNKPIFIDFFAMWCGPCKQVEKDVFNNPRVAEYMNANFINYKVDIDKDNGPTLAMLYGVDFLPTVVIVKPNGKVIMKKSTIMDTSKFLSWAKTGKKYFSYSKMDKSKKLDISETKDYGAINFIKDQSFYEIKELAQKKNKPIFLDFHAAWCGPCRMMDEEVFNDSNVANYMNNNFINYKVDVSTRMGKNMAYKYDISQLPTLIIVSPTGEVISRESRFMDDLDFMDFAKNASIY